MNPDVVNGVIWLAVVAGVALLFAQLRRRRIRPGPGTIGTVYDWLNEERRNAVEIIVEDRAAARDPEDKDGNLPDLTGRRSRP